MVYVEPKELQSNEKALLKATFRKVNSKIKIREGNSRIKTLLACNYPLTGKV